MDCFLNCSRFDLLTCLFSKFIHSDLHFLKWSHFSIFSVCCLYYWPFSHQNSSVHQSNDIILYYWACSVVNSFAYWTCARVGYFLQLDLSQSGCDYILHFILPKFKMNYGLHVPIVCSCLVGQPCSYNRYGIKVTLLLICLVYLYLSLPQKNANSEDHRAIDSTAVP